MAGIMSIKCFRPIADRILVNVHKEESDSPIIRPIGYISPKAEHVKATIVSKGTYVTEVHNRDVVLIEKNSGTEIIIKGISYRLLKVCEVIAKL